MAPDRSVGSPRRPDQAHRLPRNHQAGDSGSHREAAHGQYGPGQRPAGTPHPRPAGRLRAVAGAVEEGTSGAVGRPRAVGRRAPDRGARARDHRLPLGSLFPCRGPVLRRRRPGEDALQGRTFVAFRNRGAGRNLPAKLHRRHIHGGQGRGETRTALPRAAVHHLDAPAGGGPQAGHVRIADDVRRAAPLRAGSDHLHAYRLGEPLAAGAGPVQGGDHETLRREIFALVQLQDQDQRCAGGPRGHPPVVHRASGDRGHARREEALRPDLEAHGRLADGLRRIGPHDHHHRHVGQFEPVRRTGRGGPFRRLPAPLLRIHGRRPGCRERRGAAAETHGRRPGPPVADHRHGALHLGSGAL